MFHLRHSPGRDAAATEGVVGQFEEGQATKSLGAVGQLGPAGVVAVQKGLGHCVAISCVGRPGAAGGGSDGFGPPGGQGIGLGQLVEDSDAGGIERKAAANQIGGKARAPRVAFAERQHLGDCAICVCAGRIGGGIDRGGDGGGRCGAGFCGLVASVIWVSGMVVLV